jgi:hypothetical protein
MWPSLAAKRERSSWSYLQLRTVLQDSKRRIVVEIERERGRGREGADEDS